MDLTFSSPSVCLSVCLRCNFNAPLLMCTCTFTWQWKYCQSKKLEVKNWTTLSQKCFVDDYRLLYKLFVKQDSVFLCSWYPWLKIYHLLWFFCCGIIDWTESCWVLSPLPSPILHTHLPVTTHPQVWVRRTLFGFEFCYKLAHLALRTLPFVEACSPQWEHSIHVYL